MKRIFLIIVILILSYIFMESPGYSFWIWTPETGKWINPKYAVKDTPKEQFQFAIEFFNSKDYSKAITEFRKLVKHYPDSKLAPEALFYIAQSYERLEKFYQAFSTYQDIINRYPYFERTNEVIERQYRIGNLYFTGKKQKFLGISLFSSEDKAIEIYEKVIDNSPYGEYADKSWYKLGLLYKRMGNYIEAKNAFKKILKDYPKSDLYSKAEYELALCSYKISLKPEYTQEHTDEAIERLKKIVKEESNPKIVEQASSQLKELNEKKAKSLYDIAKFYERIHQVKSAILYYEEIVDKFPKTSFAALSLEKLTALRKKDESKK